MMFRDNQSVNPIENEVISGDKIEVGNITGSIAAIGNGAQVIVNQINEAYSAIAEMEKGIQAAEQHLATEIKKKANRFIQLAQETQLDDQNNPYKALLDYEIKDAPFFYGREDATKVMFDKLNRNNLTILHADSGSGKTSLLQAGLASRLLAQGHFPLYLRPYKQPPEKFIKKAFLSDYETLEELARFRDENMSLRGFLERVTYYLGDRKLYIFLDQFEEFFTELRLDEQRKFVDQLQECDVPDLNVRWVLSIRKEFFSNLHLFKGLKPFENEYFLPTFNLVEAKEVITKPAARKDVRFESGLVDKILADIQQQTHEISPPQVQLVCYTLFEELQQEDNQQLITFDLYAKPRGRGGSGVEGILTSHLTGVLNKRMNAEQRQIARQVLESLVTSQKRRVVKSRSALETELEPNSPMLIAGVLGVMVENRLLRTDEDEADEPLYELSHDYLLTEIEIDPETQARKAAQELLLQETVTYRVHGTLLSADKFAIINSQSEFLVINDDEKELLRLSATALKHERMQRVVTATIVVVLIIGALLLVLLMQQNSATELAHSATQEAILLVTADAGSTRAVSAQMTSESDRATAEAASTVAIEQEATAVAERAEANRQSNIALARQLAAESGNILDTDPEKSIQLALEAVAIAKDLEEPIFPDAMKALHRAAKSLRIQKIFNSHTGMAFDVSFSLDGNHLASGDYNGNVFVRELGTNKLPFSLPRNPIPLTGVKINKDGSYLYLTDGLGNLEIWNLETRQLEYTKNIHDEDMILDTDLALNGSMLATTGADNVTRILDLPAGEVVLKIPLENIGCGVAFNADNSLVVTGDMSGTIYVWDILKKEEIYRFKHAADHQEACAVAFSPDSQKLATGGIDMTTKLWSLEPLTLLQTFSQHTDTIYRIAFDFNEKLLATAGFDKKVNIYDVESGTLLQTLKGNKGRIRAIAFAPDGDHLATADESGEIRLWNVSFGFHSDMISKVLFSPDGRFFASASADGTIKVWEADSDRLLREFDVGGRIYDIDFHPDQMLIASVNDQGLVQMWDITTSNHILDFSINAAQSGSIAFSPDGQLLVVAGDEGIELLDIVDQKRIDTIPTSKPIYSVTFHPNGARLAIVTADGLVRVWDLLTDKVAFELTHDSNAEIFRVAFSPNGALLATAGVDKKIEIWDAATGMLITELIGHTDNIYDVKFSPDSNYLASASGDQSVRVWDLTSIDRNLEVSSILEFDDFSNAVFSVNFSPDGKQVIAAGVDQVIRRYILSLDELIEEIEKRLIELNSD